MKDTTEYSTIPDLISNKPMKTRPKKHEIDANFKPMYEMTSLNFNQGQMKYDKLKNILKQFNEYPEKYRIMIW